MKKSKPTPYRHAGFHGWIGVGRRDITPPVGIYSRNWGAAKSDTAEGIHRPLCVTTLTLRAAPGEKPLVLVALDLGWWKTNEDEWFVRSAVIETFALDPSRVMINLGHSHATPSPNLVDKDLPGGHLIPAYRKKVRAMLVEAVRDALDGQVEGCLDWTAGRCDLAVNRDLPDPDGERRICGYHPYAAADDTILIGRATRMDGGVLATVVNYACHPTTLAWDNLLISPDYPGAMREVVERATAGAPCLFLQGNSGELSPKEQYLGDTAVADAHGRKLGYAVLSALEGMISPQQQLAYAGIVESGTPLAMWKREAQAYPSTLKAMQLDVVQILKKLPSMAELKQKQKNCADRAIQERLTRQLRIRGVIGDGDATIRGVWVWKVGDAFIVGQMDEAYSDLQIELRKRFAPHPVVVMNLVNGGCSYISPDRMYHEEVYPVIQSSFARGCFEKLLEECDRAVRSML